MEFSVIARLVIVMVVTVLIIILAVGVPEFGRETASKVISYMPVVEHQSENCGLYCYSQPTPYALNVMFGNAFSERNYLNVNGLPAFFSCNYQLLDIATQVLEIARWKADFPTVIISGITEDDDLFFNDGKKITDISLSNDRIIKGSCSIDEVNSKLICVNDECLTNSFSFHEDDSNQIFNCDYCDKLFNELNICSLPVYSVGSDKDLRSSPCVVTLNEKTSTDYFYPGGDKIFCNNLFISDGEVIVGSDSNCYDYYANNLVDCSDAYYSCTINFAGSDCLFDEGVVKCRESSDESYQQCSVIYSAGNCLIICNNDKPVIDMTGYVPEGEYFVSDLSNNYFFGDIIGYKLLRVFINDESTIFNDRKFYSILVAPEHKLLVPRDRVITQQAGLRNFEITFNPIYAFDTSKIPLKDDAWIVRGDITMPYYFENATLFLFNCLANGVCDEEPLHSFYYFSQKDSFLNNYHYINLLDKRTLNDKVGPFTYFFHNNSFLSTMYVNGGFDACNYEPESYPRNFRPAWQTLVERQGSCEDLALMDYALFKALGVSDNDLNPRVYLNMSYCGLPCPCRRLFDECGLNYRQVSCAAPQIVTVEPVNIYGSFNACPETLEGYPEGLNGSTYLVTVNGRDYTVHQNFTAGGDYYYPVYLNPDLFNGVFNYISPEGSFTGDYCGADYDFTNDLALCSEFIDFNDKNDFQRSVLEVCDG